MKNQICLVAILVAGLMIGCASKPIQTVETEPMTPEFQDENGDAIDMAGLRSYLKMDREDRDLGFAEKAFFTCAVGHGFSGSHNCRPQYLVVLNFRIQCRDSEGTVSSVTNEELVAVSSNHLRWSVGENQGFIKTDGDGFGQLITLAPTSFKQKKLRLTHNNDFLLMTAKEVSRIIVPRPWCRDETRGAAN